VNMNKKDFNKQEYFNKIYNKKDTIKAIKKNIEKNDKNELIAYIENIDKDLSNSILSTRSKVSQKILTEILYDYITKAKTPKPYVKLKVSIEFLDEFLNYEKPKENQD